MAAETGVADTGEASVPATVQQVLAARIDRLSADQKAAIQLAAVLGREFPLDLAEEVWDGDVSLAERFQELKALEFVRERYGLPDRVFVFKHALTREVAYDSLLHARRRELHGRVGAALEDSEASQGFERSELLGYHYSRSAEPARAIPHLAAAGDRARDRYANEEAAALYRRAIGLLEELPGGRQPDVYGAICQGLGVVLERLSRYDAAIDAYQKALGVASDPFQRAHLHVLCSEAETAAHRHQEALAQCDLAEQALGPASDAPGSRWLSSWLAVQGSRMEALYWLNDTEGHARLIERVRPLVETHGSAEQRASFFVSIVQLSFRRDRYLVADETLEFARAASAAVQEVAPSPWWWSGFTLGFTLLFHGDLDEATAVLRESLEEGERQGDAGTRARSLTYLMVADRKRGDVDAVREAIGSVIERAREASLPEYEAMAIANRAWVAWRMGEEEAAATDAAAALEMWKRLPVRYFFDWMALWPLVAMALASGRVEAAAEYARRMLPPPQQLLQEPARTLVDRAVHAWDAGMQAETEQLLGRAVRSAGGLGYL